MNTDYYLLSMIEMQCLHAVIVLKMQKTCTKMWIFQSCPKSKLSTMEQAVVDRRFFIKNYWFMLCTCRLKHSKDTIHN